MDYNPLTLEDPLLRRVAEALKVSRAGDPDFLSQITPSPLGAVSLFPLGFFPWGALPYPHLHAQLGRDLAILNQTTLATSIARFHQVICDHALRPLPSVFCQEGRVPLSLLQEKTDALFEAVGTTSLLFPLVDEECGIWRTGNAHTTALLTASGCQTSLGAFLQGDAGVIIFGPQLSVAGDCRGFGIAGKPQYLKHQCVDGKIFCSYRNRLGKLHTRQTGLDFLSDSNYSGLWVDVEHHMEPHQLATELYLQGPGEHASVLWVVFGKGHHCVVAGSHRLSPNSLDRYQGPIQRAVLEGQEGCVFIESAAAGRMEIIPLAGNSSFWGADFLLLFQPQALPMQWTFSC